MDTQQWIADMENLKATNVTKTVHSAAYPAISPLRAELSQAGRTVLITGGATGCGLAIAKGFIAAKAACVIIVGRRVNALSSAQKELEQEAVRLSSPTVILYRRCDVAVEDDVEKLWADPEIGPVHVLVLSAARFQMQPMSLVDRGYKEVWSDFETNVKGPLHMTEKFSKQTTPEGQSVAPKFLVNLASLSIHAFDPAFSPAVTAGPSYALTKNAGALAIQLVAANADPDQMQVVSFHPGILHSNTQLELFNIGPRDMPFDDPGLPGSFAVWLASTEARFLHGRFVWASWDVEELAAGDLRKRLEEDYDFLRVGVVGIKGNKLV